MATADRYLAEDEELLYETRQHWTTIIDDFLRLVLVGAVAGALVWALPTGEDWGRTAAWVVLGLAVIAAVWTWLVPLLLWRSALYFLTTKRLHERSGFLTKKGRSIPLSRVNDVSFTATLWQRIMRYGTLHVQSASEHGMMTFRRIPDPEGFKNRVYQALDALPRDAA